MLLATRELPYGTLQRQRSLSNAVMNAPPAASRRRRAASSVCRLRRRVNGSRIERGGALNAGDSLSPRHQRRPAGAVSLPSLEDGQLQGRRNRVCRDAPPTGTPAGCHEPSITTSRLLEEALDNTL